MTPSVRAVAQGALGSGTAVTTGAFAVDPVPGDTIVVFLVTYPGGATHNAPTDAKGNAYTALGTTQHSADPNHKLSMWHAPNISTGGSGFTVTASVTGSAGELTAIAYCLKDTASVPAVGDWKTANTDSPGTGTDAVTTGTTTVSPSSRALAIGATANSGNTADTSDGTGWTRPTNGAQPNNSTLLSLYTEYKVTSTTYAATWTAAHNNAWNVQMTASFVGVPARLVADAGAYTVTGTAAGLRGTRRVVAAAGTAAVTGTAATLTYVPVVLQHYTLVADSGSCTVAGVVATLRPSRRLPAAGGSVAYAGPPAVVRRGTGLPAGAGAYVSVGPPVALRATRVIVAGSTTSVWTAPAASLIYRTAAAPPASVVETTFHVRRTVEAPAFQVRTTVAVER